MIPRTPQQDWFFTFGSGHTHPVTGESLERRYVAIRGDHDSARAKMVRAFGLRWSHQYASRAEFGVEKYGLVELPFDERQEIVEVAAERTKDLLERLPDKESRAHVVLALADYFEVPIGEEGAS